MTDSDYTEERPYTAFTLSACQGPTPHGYCQGGFETKAGRRVWCNCPCHQERYEVWLEQETERNYFRGGHR